MGCKLERGCQYPPDATSLLSEDLIVCPLHPREEPLHNIYSDNTNILVVLCIAQCAMHLYKMNEPPWNALFSPSWEKFPYFTACSRGERP